MAGVGGRRALAVLLWQGEHGEAFRDGGLEPIGQFWHVFEIGLDDAFQFGFGEVLRVPDVTPLAAAAFPLSVRGGWRSEPSGIDSVQP